MENNFADTALSELICTRISHDIIGNVGAVANAVELLEEGDMDFLDDIRSILKVSSSVLSSRLKFFRLAFGLSNANLENVEQIKTTAENYLKTLGNPKNPITLELELHTLTYGRQVLLGIMIIADTLIKGGKIEAREVNGGLGIIAHSQTPLANEKINKIKQVLSGEQPENIAQYAPVYYLDSLLQAKQQQLSLIETLTFGLIIK